ncbi:MAG: crossover junction endodeoxyribonuclease RuvC [Chloroflexota bacterium]
MKVLGIDPGTLVMGYGVVESRGDDLVMIDCGALRSPGNASGAERLSYLYRELTAIISRHRPDVVAVEQPFVAKNVRSALAIGRAQAIALLAAANQKIPSYEYPPTRIKQQVTSYGAGSKEQVQEMVRLQLNLAEIPQPHDAADALAVALCHLQETYVSRLLAREGER